MPNRKLNPGQLYRLRRLRKARRLWKKEPLFAYVNMQADYKDYSYAEFLDDLRRRSKRKKRPKKSSAHQYGRYGRMMQLLEAYHRTGDSDRALAAIKLSRLLRRPYRVRVKMDGQWIEYLFSPFINICYIEKLVKELPGCKNEAEADAMAAAFRKAHFAR